MNKVPITVRGAEKLNQELMQLKTSDRPKVIEAIAEARAHGDLKENAEYHAAREQQSFIEGRIKDIEAKLSNATIIDITTINANGKVVFGSTNRDGYFIHATISPVISMAICLCKSCNRLTVVFSRYLSALQVALAPAMVVV